VAANAIGPASELGEDLADLEATFNVGNLRTTERRDRGGEADLVAIAAGPAGVPGFDLADLGAGENQAAVVGCVAKVDAVVGGHLAADSPAVLLVATIGESVALGEGRGGAAVRARARVECAGDRFLFEIDEDVEDAAGAGWIMISEVHAPILAAIIIDEPAGHGDHRRVDHANVVAENGPHLRIGRGDSNGFG